MKLTIDINNETYKKIAIMSNGNIQKFVETLVEQFAVLEYIEYEFNREDYYKDSVEEEYIDEYCEDYEDYLLENEEELRKKYFEDINSRMYTPDELRLGE